MVETVLVESPQNPKPKRKATLEIFVGDILDYLRDHPNGATVQELASIKQIPPATVRKVLEIIALVMSKVIPLYAKHGGVKIRLLLTRSPNGKITAVRIEVVTRELPEEGSDIEGDPNQKPTYTMGPADMAEVQRAWKVYQATGRAFRHDDAARLAPLCERYPGLFTQNATKTGLLPTMTLFTVARTLEQYASLGRLPGIIDTAVAVITFEGE